MRSKQEFRRTFRRGAARDRAPGTSAQSQGDTLPTWSQPRTCCRLWSDGGLHVVRSKHALSHHIVATLPVILAQREVEGRLRHAVCVFDIGLERDPVLLSRLGMPEKAEVNDEPRVNRLSHRAVREGVTVDLADGQVNARSASAQAERLACVCQGCNSDTRVVT